MAGNDVNTLLLLHGEDLTDASQYARVLTNSGVTVSDAQSKFGGKSLYFNGAAFLSVIDSAFVFGNNDLTVDWWQFTQVAGTSACINVQNELGYSQYFIGYNSESLFSSYNGTTWDSISNAPALQADIGKWTHWAFVKNGTNITVYRNGVSRWNGAVRNEYAGGIGQIIIGCHADPSTRNFLTGYIDEFRVSNMARWTGNFTPPSVAYEYDKPEALQNLSCAINGAGGIDLTWDAVEHATLYKITKNGIPLASITETHYTDSAVSSGELYVYVVTPYNRTQAGAGASIEIRTGLDTPANLNAALDGHTVTLTWDAVNGAEGYYVYRDRVVVASVTSASFTDTLIPPVSVYYAVSAYVGTIQSEISRPVVVENREGILLAMITDRTAADVAEAKRLRDKIFAGEALTDEEFARYNAGLRGCYNASDMNRVGAAVRYVAGRLNAEGYGAYVSPKTDWQMEDAVRHSDWNKYLDEVRHLRRKLTPMRTTPQITDGMYGGLKSYAEANAIEQILVDLDWMLTNIIRNYIYAGEVFAGEV